MKKVSKTGEVTHTLNKDRFFHATTYMNVRPHILLSANPAREIHCLVTYCKHICTVRTTTLFYRYTAYTTQRHFMLL